MLGAVALALIATGATAASPRQTCRSQPLAGVYHPARLHVMNACVTVSGTVEAVRHEADTDYHINVRLDARYAALINQKNVTQEHGDLVVEIIPMDEPNLPTPRVGEHVTFTGAYVLDTAHGWMEVHPAWIVNGQGTISYTLSAAAASVQAGVCGNGDTDCTLTRSPPTSTHTWPAGATAECKDGTFSYSQHHRGACSRHGGVLAWRR
ncbi:MAG: DUF3761 domain-containing protein [Deinococcales bacterium]